jgi:DNA mismatch repair ATPase MutS
MKNFWNPFINPAKVVSNDLNLQGPDRRNMIITGPNAGGKSTLIKAVPINLILSQSIGLTAASYAEITPFYSIATYLNIVDDIAAGNSLFKAQVLRAQEMINLVEQTQSNKFSFVALDEMFNGTSAKESMAAAYSVVKHIGQYPNNISIVATHFPLLTNLEGEIDAFANYKVSVEVDDKKGIYYPFKLEHGSSTQHVALNILRQEGYDCTILAEATEILKTASI